MKLRKIFGENIQEVDFPDGKSLKTGGGDFLHVLGSSGHDDGLESITLKIKAIQWETYAAIAALLLMTIGSWLGYQRTAAQEMKHLRAEVTTELLPFGAGVDEAIGRHFLRLESIASFVQAKASQAELRADFEQFATGLRSERTEIRAIQVFPAEGRILVFPTAGNEATLQRTLDDLINDDRPNVRLDVKRAIETRQIAISGPYNLRQGGQGLVMRKAIFTGERFRGMAVVVLDMAPLLKTAGLQNYSDGLNLALRDRSGKLLFGDERVFAANPAVYRVALPDGDWHLAAVPAKGWDQTIQADLNLLKIGSLVFVVLTTALIYLVVQRYRRLEMAVRSRTAELAASRALYYRLFNRNVDAVLLVDGTGNIMMANASACRTYGYGLQDFRRMNIDRLWPADCTDGVMENICDTISDKEPMRWRHMRQNGTEVPVEASSAPVYLGNQRFVLLSIRDITRQEVVEERLRLSQREQVFGELAGRVAHDFNNRLQAIQMNLDICLKSVEADKNELKTFLARTMTIVGESSKLVADLLGYSGRRLLRPEKIEPAIFLREVRELVEVHVGRDIRINLDVVEELPAILVDPHALQSAIINLAVNADYAMPAGGMLSIQARVRVLGEQLVHNGDRIPAGKFLEISVADSGCGMPAEIQKKAFEPFFKAEEDGKGHGLGLSMVYGFCHQSGGVATLESELGHGTTARLYFPVTMA